MSHSILAPSSAAIWGKPDGCTGHVLMAQAYPDIEGPEAIEGNSFHSLVAFMLLSNSVGENIQAKLDYDWHSEEMIEAAKLCRDDVLAIKEKHQRGFPEVAPVHCGIEKTVVAPQIHELSFGTLDYYLYNHVARDLFIWDFKYGYGLIEVFENWQMINYAAALFDEFKINGIDDQNLTVHFRLVQPRAFHQDGPIRTWSIRGSDLRAYFNILATNAAIAVSDKAETQSGTHCRNCSARHACKTALEAGMNLYETADRPTPINLSAEELSTQFSLVVRARKQLEYLESGFEAEIMARVRNGKNIPGYRIEMGKGREQWARPVSEIKALGELMGIALDTETVISPYQARKRGIDSAVVDAYAERPNRGIKLVADDGSRARQIFGRKEPQTNE